jgi:hypothetical protein
MTPPLTMNWKILLTLLQAGNKSVKKRQRTFVSY